MSQGTGKPGQSR